jgi:hypothetical protein
MTVYFSASREQRNDLRRRQAVAERLRHHTRASVAAELHQAADTNPPTYLETARHLSRAGGVS